MATPIGILSKLYYNTGTYGSPTWTEVTAIGDLAINPVWEEADISTRGSRVRSMKKTIMAIEITGTLKKVPGNSVYADFVDALMSDDLVDILVLDGASTANDTRGYRMDVQVFSGNDDQSLAGGGFLELTLKPNQDTNPVKAVLVTGGSPTFATPGAAGGTYA